MNLDKQAGGQIYANTATNLGIFTINIDDSITPTAGRLSVSGNLNVNNTILTIAANGVPTSTPYIIASYGTLTGTFSATNGLPSGYSLNMNYSGLSQIALTSP